MRRVERIGMRRLENRKKSFLFEEEEKKKKKEECIIHPLSILFYPIPSHPIPSSHFTRKFLHPNLYCRSSVLSLLLFLPLLLLFISTLSLPLYLPCFTGGGKYITRVWRKGKLGGCNNFEF